MLVNIGNPILCVMDWKQIIADLIAEGWTQKSIADACGVKQPSISDLARGITKRPSFDLCDPLKALHKEVTKRKRKSVEA